MKKETLQARIKKHLYTKGGKLAKKDEDVIVRLNNPERVMRPIYGGYKGRTLHDGSANLECGLQAIGIDYETGNDAPRGGKNGYFVKLTSKGRRQVADYNRQK